MSFEPGEFEARLQRAQGLMQQHEIDLLLLSTHPDIFWFTGFLTRFWESPTRPWFLLVPVQGQPVAVIPAIGEALMRQSWLEDIRTWPAPTPEDEGVSLLAETLLELLPATGARLAIPDGAETLLRMPVSDWQALHRAISPRAFGSDQGIMRQLRQIKSSAEIACIENSCRIAARAFDRLTEVVQPGVSLAQVFRRFQCLCLEEGADAVPYLAGGAGPHGYADVISPATDTPLQRGDVLMLDTGLVANGYFCDYDRNRAVCVRSPEQQSVHARLIDATAAAFEVCKVGNRASDVHAVMHRELSRGPGAPDRLLGGRLGHGLGIQLTEWPSLLANDHTVLEAGMVLTLEPWLEVRQGALMVHEENIVVEAQGPRWLSQPDRHDLTVLNPE